MEILNGTPQTIVGDFDGVSYLFPPMAVQAIPDEAGEHLLVTHGRCGLVRVQFGDDANEAKLTCVRNRLTWLRGHLAAHANAQHRQGELKFPPLPKSEVVAMAERDVPVLEALEAQLLAAGAGARQVSAEDQARAAAAVPVRMPTLEDMPIEKLRAQASKMGLSYPKTITKAEVIRLIREAQHPEAVEHAGEPETAAVAT